MTFQRYQDFIQRSRRLTIFDDLECHFDAFPFELTARAKKIDISILATQAYSIMSYSLS